MESTDLIFGFFLFVCALQLLFPVLAGKIKKRFRKLGYRMKSEPMWSMFNVSKFWVEARSKNEELQDPAIAGWLRLLSAWWGLAIASFACVLLAGF